jgi:hypothetical protein
MDLYVGLPVHDTQWGRGWNRNICFTYTFGLTSAAQVTLEMLKGKKGDIPSMPWRHIGGAGVWLHSFCTLALDGGWCSASCPDCCTPEKEP